MQVQL